jgi:hypothetical protein
MTRAPTRTAIYAAELRVAQCRLNARNGVRRTRAAIRAKLVQPSTLGFVAGGAALAGIWLGHRAQAAPATAAGAEASPATRASARKRLVTAFLLRYAAKIVPFIAQQMRAAQDRAHVPGGTAQE